MYRFPLLLACAVALLATFGTVSASAASPSILYSASASSAVIGGRQVTFPTATPASWFTDRPGRRAGQTTLASIVSLWSASGFDRTPPNAALVTTRGGTSMTTIVTLSSPRLAGKSVTFRFRVLKNGAAMGMRTSGTPRAGSYGRTELFLDGAADPPCGYALDNGQSCLFDVANGAYTYLAADPGHVTLCSVGAQASGVDITWYSVSAVTGQPVNNVVSGAAPPVCSATATYGTGSAYARSLIRVTRGSSPSGVVRISSTS